MGLCRGGESLPFYDRIKAVEGHRGRDPVDPRILLALWLYATTEGVGSARQLARLCERDVVYRWICGGVSVNHRLLSEFRSGHSEWLDGQLTASVAGLIQTGLVTLNRVSQDGMRVRASAGKSSFRRKPTLEEDLQIATEHLKRLREELQTHPPPRRPHAAPRPGNERSRTASNECGRRWSRLRKCAWERVLKRTSDAEH